MRKLGIGIAIAALLWCGYWFAGSSLIRQGVTDLADQERARGVSVDYGDVSVGGFPSRFDLTFTDLRLLDPQSGMGWHGPILRIFAMAYNPQHLIAIAPASQVVSLRGVERNLTADDLRASVSFLLGPAFALNRSRIVGSNMEMGDWALGTLRASSDLQGGEAGHRLGLELLGLTLPAALRAQIDPQEGEPATVDRLHLDARARFDRPIDRTTLDDPPHLTALDIADLTGIWGDIQVTAAGSLTADGNGFARGDLKITVRNWRKMLNLAVSAGLVPADRKSAIKSTLGFLSGQSDKITATLTFRDGLVLLGPLPLGTAPRFGTP